MKPSRMQRGTEHRRPAPPHPSRRHRCRRNDRRRMPPGSGNDSSEYRCDRGARRHPHLRPRRMLGHDEAVGVALHLHAGWTVEQSARTRPGCDSRPRLARPGTVSPPIVAVDDARRIYACTDSTSPTTEGRIHGPRRAARRLAEAWRRTEASRSQSKRTTRAGAPPERASLRSPRRALARRRSVTSLRMPRQPPPGRGMDADGPLTPRRAVAAPILDHGDVDAAPRRARRTEGRRRVRPR